MQQTFTSGTQIPGIPEKEDVRRVRIFGKETLLKTQENVNFYFIVKR